MLALNSLRNVPWMRIIPLIMTMILSSLGSILIRMSKMTSAEMAQSKHEAAVAASQQRLMESKMPLSAAAAGAPSTRTYAYDGESVILLCETIKLTVTLFFLFRSGSFSAVCGQVRYHFHRKRTGLKFSIPAFLYVIDNNLPWLILSLIDPPTQVLVSQLKIVIIAFLCHFVLSQRFSTYQKAALLLLFVGVITAKSAPTPVQCQKMSSGTGSTADAMSSKSYFSHLEADEVLGILLAFFAVLCSSAADIATRVLIKEEGKKSVIPVEENNESVDGPDEPSIHMLNLFMYSWGVGLNLLLVLWRTGGRLTDMFHGFNIYAWLVAFVTASLGLSISFVFRYWGNITRLVLNICAMLIVMFLSSIWFDFVITEPFLCGIAVIWISLFVYNQEREKKNGGEKMAPS